MKQPGSRIKDRIMMRRLLGNDFENKIRLTIAALISNCVKVEQQGYSKRIDDRCKGKVQLILNKHGFSGQLCSGPLQDVIRPGSTQPFSIRKSRKKEAADPKIGGLGYPVVPVVHYGSKVTGIALDTKSKGLPMV
jgi:hypothetical protein